MKKITLCIDADKLLYDTVFAREYNTSELDGDNLNGPTLKELKPKFKKKLQAVIDECELDTAIGSMTKFEDVKCFFTGKTNFRYDLFQSYKYSRLLKEKPPVFRELKNWVIKKYGVVSDLVEADDYVNYYSRQGHPIASADKDVLKNTVGYHYDMYHRTFINTTKKDAKEFLAIQCVNGDNSTDNISGLRTPKGDKFKGDLTVTETPLTKTNPDGIGLARVGETVAIKLLDGDYSMAKVIQIYLDHNFTREYAITQINLIRVDPIKKVTKSGKVKLKLFKGVK